MASPERPLLRKFESRPLVERARRELLDAIQDGRLVHKLPAETTLAQMLNVSRTTIRAALQTLEQDGFVTRRRSIGTIINTPTGAASWPLNQLAAFETLLAERGFEVVPEVDWRVDSLPTRFVTLFDLTDDTYLVSDMSYVADGDVAVHLQDVVPLSSLRPDALEELDRIQEAGPSVFDLSQQYFMTPIRGAIAQLNPVLRGRDSDSHLEVLPERPFLRLLERHVSKQADVVAYSIIDVDDRYLRFDVYRRR